MSYLLWLYPDDDEWMLNKLLHASFLLLKHNNSSQDFSWEWKLKNHAQQLVWWMHMVIWEVKMYLF